jgi:two-component system cell cycle response regulator
MRVLIVDNSPLFHEMISRLFVNTPLEPEWVLDGRSALAAIQRNTYAFICSSYYLKDMSGVELCREARRMRASAYTPFILFTSEPSLAIIQEAYIAGVTDIFSKEDIEQLVIFIRRLLSHYQPTQGDVLVVEDSAAQAEYYARTLEGRGLTVARAGSGEEALQLVVERNFDLVVTDIVLGGPMSGIALVNRIRRLLNGRGDIPILAVTAFDDLARRIELFYLGVNDYVIKPLAAEELIARARTLVSHRQLRQRIQAEAKAA